MQVFSKNGINFIIDLVWQRQNEENKVNLWQLKNLCQFDMYCKNTHNLIPTYGFIKLSGQKIKKPVSLALYIVALSEIEHDNEDMFICFRFDDTRIGFVLVYRGSIYPNGGEFIGSDIEARSRMLSLAKEANIKLAYITDDVPFYDNHHLEVEGDFKTVVIRSENNLSSSEYYFWHAFAAKKVINKARLHPIKRIATKYKVGGIVGVIIALLLLVNLLKNQFLTNHINLAIAPAKVNVNSRGVASNIFLANCFKYANSYFNNIPNWSITKLSCKMQGLNVNYTSNNASETSLKQALQGILIDKRAKAKLSFLNNSATLTVNFNLTKVKFLKLNHPLSVQVDTLSKLANELNFSFHMKQTPAFQIVSTYSPFFLYNNGVLDEVNINSIVMQTTVNGFLNWTIQGELSGK